MTGTLIASIDRAAGHALVLGVLVLIAAVVGLGYGLVQLAGRRRAGRAPSDRGQKRAERPDS